MLHVETNCSKLVICLAFFSIVVAVYFRKTLNVFNNCGNAFCRPLLLFAMFPTQRVFQNSFIALHIHTAIYEILFLYPGYLRKRHGILVLFTVFDKKVVICHLSLRIFAIVCSLNRCLFHIFANKLSLVFLLPTFQYCWKTDRLSSSEISAVHFCGHAEPHGGAKARALKLLPVSDT